MSGKIFVSVSCLVSRVRISFESEPRYVGILNKHALVRDGTRIYTALGGAVEMTDQGLHRLTTEFGVTFTHGRDARFECARDQLGALMELFRARDCQWSEINPNRELYEELTGVEFPGQEGPIMPPELLEGSIAHYLDTRVQEGALLMTSMRGGGLPSVRIFHLFELTMLLESYVRLRFSPYTREFSADDLQRPRDAEGRIPLPDGSFIGSNIVFG